MLEAHFMPNLGQRVGPLALPSFWVLATQAITLVPKHLKTRKGIKITCDAPHLRSITIF
jgi:hypothetical protein